MEKSFILAIIASIVLMAACSKEGTAELQKEAVPGVVKGWVVDTKGKGIANAKVVIEHTVLYGKYVYATTDANGYYKTNVPDGSWQAKVQIQRSLLDKTYNFELTPDVDDAFAGKDGAVRNFSWKLNGTKSNGSGYYGSYIAVYNEPGADVNMDDVEITLTPEGPLVDGSMGATIVKKLTDIGGGQDGICDVPIGIYNIKARNTATGQPFQIRLRNTGTYGYSVSGMFDSWFTGVNSYQIAVQVK